MPRKSKQKQVEAVKEQLQALAQTVAQETEESLEERRPGQIRGTTKMPWTYKDLEKAYGIMTFTPDETIKITVSGVLVQLIADMEITCPRCFYDTWQDYRRRLRRPERNLKGYDVLAGAGGLPPVSY